MSDSKTDRGCVGQNAENSQPEPASATVPSLLEQAIQIAVEAHRGQRDRYGAPYVLHPLRMMCRFRDETAMIVAVLHDVVEDSDWTLDQLRERGFSEAIIEAVDCLTRRGDETYQTFVDRSGSNPLAARIKLADLEDNLDMRRLDRMKPEDLERFNRYLAAWRKLTSR